MASNSSTIQIAIFCVSPVCTSADDVSEADVSEADVSVVDVAEVDVAEVDVAVVVSVERSESELLRLFSVSVTVSVSSLLSVLIR